MQQYIKRVRKKLSCLQAMHIALLAKIDVRHVQGGQLLRFAPVTVKGQQPWILGKIAPPTLES